jgi:ArsR family metal-binding transcriptional regulator
MIKKLNIEDVMEIINRLYPRAYIDPNYEDKYMVRIILKLEEIDAYYCDGRYVINILRPLSNINDEDILKIK